MKKILLSLCILIVFTASAQKELDIQLNAPIFKNLLLTAEKPVVKYKKTTTFVSVSHKFPSEVDLRWGDFFDGYIDTKTVKRNKVEFGVKSYILPLNEEKWFNAYLSASLQAGSMSRSFTNYFDKISADSLSQKAITIGIEGTGGLKFIFGKRFIFSPSLGLSYTKGFYDEKKLSRNPKQWLLRDWFEGPQSEQPPFDERRKYIINSNFGLFPALYLNFGYRF